MGAKYCARCRMPVLCECGDTLEDHQHNEVLLALLVGGSNKTTATSAVAWAREALKEIKKPTIKQEHE